MAGSISGLSGFDSATFVEQLMQLEAAPQNRLKTRQTTEKSVLAALQALNTSIAALKTQAETLAKPATWQAVKGTSSSTAVAATIAGTAAPGALTVTVDRVAVPHQLGFGQPAALDDVVASPPVVRITGNDGTVHDLVTGGGSLKEIVNAINNASAETGVRATTVRVADGSYQLMVQATQTGAAGRFTLTLQDGSALLGGPTVQQGQDAQISLGVGITATSSTNTFADVMPGVTLAVDPAAAAGSTATVTITRDTASVKDAVKALVDKVNSLLTAIDAQTKPGTGVLAQEQSARGTRSALLETIFGDGTTTMAGVGIQTDRYGKLVFDAQAFDTAYAADPAAVAAKFTTGGTNGWAARVATAAKAASDPVSGNLTGAVTGRRSAVDRLQDSIDSWDLRLELRQKTLSRQYSALETTLARLQSQGSWLSGQIASLAPSSDS
jgi:flagellar hook-associated protein 2